MNDVWCIGVAASDMEWLKALPASSTGPPPPVPAVQPPPVPSDVDDQQRQHIQQMLLAMQHSMPSRWAAPPVATAGHVLPGPGMPPRAAAMHPGIPHANHVPAPPPADSAVEHSVSLSLI